jgi:hypothetical protein
MTSRSRSPSALLARLGHNLAQLQSVSLVTWPGAMTLARLQSVLLVARPDAMPLARLQSFVLVALLASVKAAAGGAEATEPAGSVALAALLRELGYDSSCAGRGLSPTPGAWRPAALASELPGLAEQARPSTHEAESRRCECRRPAWWPHVEALLDDHATQRRQPLRFGGHPTNPPVTMTAVRWEASLQRPGRADPVTAAGWGGGGLGSAAGPERCSGPCAVINADLERSKDTGFGCVQQQALQGTLVHTPRKRCGLGTFQNDRNVCRASLRFQWVCHLLFRSRRPRLAMSSVLSCGWPAGVVYELEAMSSARCDRSSSL